MPARASEFAPHRVSSSFEKARLLADGKAGMNEIGIKGSGQSADLVVVENTNDVHNLVVCTLVSDACAAAALDSVKSLLHMQLCKADFVGALPR